VYGPSVNLTGTFNILVINVIISATFSSLPNYSIKARILKKFLPHLLILQCYVKNEHQQVSERSPVINIFYIVLFTLLTPMAIRYT